MVLKIRYLCLFLIIAVLFQTQSSAKEWELYDSKTGVLSKKWQAALTELGFEPAKRENWEVESVLDRLQAKGVQHINVDAILDSPAIAPGITAKITAASGGKFLGHIFFGHHKAPTAAFKKDLIVLCGPGSMNYGAMHVLQHLAKMAGTSFTAVRFLLPAGMDASVFTAEPTGLYTKMEKPAWLKNTTARQRVFFHPTERSPYDFLGRLADIGGVSPDYRVICSHTIEEDVNAAVRKLRRVEEGSFAIALTPPSSQIAYEATFKRDWMNKWTDGPTRMAYVYLAELYGRLARAVEVRAIIRPRPAVPAPGAADDLADEEDDSPTAPPVVAALAPVDVSELLRAPPVAPATTMVPPPMAAPRTAMPGSTVVQTAGGPVVVAPRPGASTPAPAPAPAVTPAALVSPPPPAVPAPTPAAAPAAVVPLPPAPTAPAAETPVAPAPASVLPVAPPVQRTTPALPDDGLDAVLAEVEAEEEGDEGEELSDIPDDE